MSTSRSLKNSNFWACNSPLGHQFKNYMKYEYYIHSGNRGTVLYRFAADKSLGNYWISDDFDPGASNVQTNIWLGPKTLWLNSNGWIPLTINQVKKKFPGAIPNSKTTRKYKAITLFPAAGFKMINENDSDWTYNGLRVCINPNKRITLQEFVDIIANQAAFHTRQEMKAKLNTAIDFEEGYNGKA